MKSYVAAWLGKARDVLLQRQAEGACGQLALAFLLGVVTCAALERMYGRWLTPTRPVEVRERSDALGDADATYRLDVNLAGVEELVQVPGIGPVLAHRIVEERERNGPYRSVDDLTRVRGIKGKTLEKLRPYVTAQPTPKVQDANR
ncbi:MAG: hypothetical protein C4297_13720 [Gemmataceae bacterium]